jgi:hypothetical protein
VTAPFYINGWPTRDISLPDEVDDRVRDEEPYERSYPTEHAEEE